MFNDFMDASILTTFVGLVTAVTVIVQFTKGLVKRKFGDSIVRIYVFIISLILITIFSKGGFKIENIIISIINAMMVTIASMGGYEILSDPFAEKR